VGEGELIEKEGSYSGEENGRKGKQERKRGEKMSGWMGKEEEMR